MAIPIKSPRDIDAMRRAGAVLRNILDEAAAFAAPGVRTREIDALIAARISERGARSAARESGFPGAGVITVNEEALHAPPGPRMLRAGDIASIDIAIRLDGWCADASRVVLIGGGDEHRALALAAGRVTAAAIAAIAPGRCWSEVVAAAVGDARGCSIVGEYAGHGIGRELHEPPVAGFHPAWAAQDWNAPPAPDGSRVGDRVTMNGPAGTAHDLVLRPGMVLTVEPVVVAGPDPRVLGLDDGWTSVTAGRAAAAHEEHTVAVVHGGALVLTGS